MTAAVVIFAVGNPSRGDDALGPALMAQISAWLEGSEQAELFELIEDFQLQIEHALDLRGRDLALFIDAGSGTPAPYHFGPVAAVDRIGHSTHALAPGSVLEVYREMEGSAPPPAFTLCLAGKSFELGAPLTAEAESHLAATFGFVQELLVNPDAAYWTSRCDARPLSG